MSFIETVKVIIKGVEIVVNTIEQLKELEKKTNDPAELRMIQQAMKKFK